MPVFSRKKLCAAVFQILGCAAAPAYASTCDELAALTLPSAAITSSTLVAAGAFTPATPIRGANPYAALPAFCRVEATLTPSADSDIKIEVWLPQNNWNRKLLGVGNGGWTGSIATAALAESLLRGYAAVSTDTGHVGGSASFALEHPEKLTDFAHRAVHEMTVQAKAIIEQFYDAAPEYTYFNGCSAGGRQGMKAAQLYPDDFDGIVAGSPGLNWTGRALQTLWVAQGVHASAESLIPAAKFPAIHAAALAACDSNDGVTDGVITNPQQCNFDPAVLLCSGEDVDACLATAQVETARRIYAPVKNTASGDTIVPGLSVGSELGWNTMASAQPFGPGVDLFKYIVFANADWDYQQFNFATDVPGTLSAAGELDALNPDLQAYFATGGKIVSYHGWSDPQISPGSTVQYYEQVLSTMGASVQDSYRLFMVPGMNHCSGGAGADNFDMLGALEAWVEQNLAPDSLTARHVENGETTFTRPLCPHPQVATYKGTGELTAAENFSCSE